MISTETRHPPFLAALRRLLCAACLLACSSPFPARAAAVVPGNLALDRAIRIGTGSKVVIEFSDPDCRFSRRMVRYWDLRKDVSRYIFLVALKNHPEAPKKARYILCAADKAAAYRAVYAGEFDFGEKALDRPCDDHGLLEQQEELAHRLGVIGTPTYFIRGEMINGARVKEIERLLGGEKIPFDAGDPE
jgi:protein-disulfide isomerase